MEHQAAHNFLDLSAVFDTADHLLFIEILFVMTLNLFLPFWPTSLWPFSASLYLLPH